MKRITFEDDAMDIGNDVDSLAARKEDRLILHHAILGHDLTETYSNARLSWRETDSLLGS